ncbi:hypothetical protein Q5O24_11980 [Eubacteriaceae bacterium ES3]|nr:hypothetical protein Q5O24_11980 [Eubacteriaceae bacterium ES3]
MARSILINDDILNETELAISDMSQNISKANCVLLDMLENYFDYLLDESKGIEALKKEHEKEGIRANIVYDYIFACEKQLKTIEKFSKIIRSTRR